MHRLKPLLLVALISLPCTVLAARTQSEPSTASASTRYVPPSPKKSVEIGNFYFRRKKYAGALSRYKEAVKSDPHYAPGYLGLGKVYQRLGLKHKALEAYQQYLDELPSKKQADEAKDVRRAIKHLKRELNKSAAKAPRAR